MTRRKEIGESQIPGHVELNYSEILGIYSDVDKRVHSNIDKA